MGYRLQMSAEFHDWLADLRDSDPPAAVLAAQALAALATEGHHLGLPLVTALPSQLGPDELLSALDRRYQTWLDSMAALRHQGAEAAALRRSIERQLAELESVNERAAAQERLAAAIEAQERLSPAYQRQQLRADAFRTRKEVLKATYAVARAEQSIEHAQGADDSADAAAARLAEITGQIEQEVGWEAPVEGLMELRPGAPADRSLRILFAVEPADTALLIAVLEGPGAVRDHYREAVLLASGVLRAVRTGQAPEAAAHTFADARSFLEEFFPGRVDELS